MPAGELFTREIRSNESPDDLHRRVVVQLTPLLAPANYKLASQDAQHVEYSRRYVPAWLLVTTLSVITLAGAANAAGDTEPAVALVGLLAAAALLLVRRREILTVSVHPRPGGSTAVLTGFLNGRGRMALLGFDPPRGPRFRIAPSHLHTADSVTDRPPTR